MRIEPLEEIHAALKEIEDSTIALCGLHCLATLVDIAEGIASKAYCDDPYSAHAPSECHSLVLSEYTRLFEEVERAVQKLEMEERQRNLAEAMEPDMDGEPVFS